MEGQQKMQKKQRTANQNAPPRKIQKEGESRAQLVAKTVVSLFMKTDEENDKGEVEGEDWIEYIKTRTKEAEEHLAKTRITCWIEAHRKMKWRMALRIASLLQDRWSNKIIERNLALDCTIKINRLLGRPRKRLDNEINEYLRPEESEETRGSDQKNNSTWTMQQKQNNWKEEEKHATTELKILGLMSLTQKNGHSAFTLLLPPPKIQSNLDVCQF